MPSLRKAISSIWQSDFSSSIISKRVIESAFCPAGIAGQLDQETRPLTRSRTHLNPAVVAIDNLIDDGKPQAGPIGKAGLKGLEKFLDLGLRESNAGVGEDNTHIARTLADNLGGQNPASGHGL